MPIVSVNRDELFAELGRSYTEDEFQELCFAYGVELDDVTSEAAMAAATFGSAAAAAAASEHALSTDVLYKIDVPANRYDLLCVEGIALALNVFRGTAATPRYALSVPVGPETIVVSGAPELRALRPVLVAAVLRGVTFTPARYASFIDLQEKLHENICRRRQYASVGTHDLDTVRGPFSYEALPPDDIVFAPLGCERAMNGTQLMRHLDTTHLKPYLPLVRDESHFPVIFDAERRVLSLPPIINGEHSKITLNTRNVFIEVTATDATKAEIVLNTITCMFARYCDAPFEIEPVTVVDGATAPRDDAERYPRLEPRTVRTSASYINSTVGVSLAPADIATLLTKMSLDARVVDGDGDALDVLVPPTRSDVLHPCDVMEDVAIAHGYDNIARTLPAFHTVAEQQPLNKLCEQLRAEMAMAGYTEALTLSLLSRADCFERMRRADAGAVTLAAAAEKKYQVVRTSLAPGLLKTLAHNKGRMKPLRLFELNDCVLLDADAETGARNVRRLAAVYCATASCGFEYVHGVADRVMAVLDVVTRDEKRRRIAAAADAAAKSGRKPRPVTNAVYEYRAADLDEGVGPHPRGMRAELLLYRGHEADNENDAQPLVVGVLGAVHPEVLGNFKIDSPASLLEIDVEPFV